MQNVINGVTFSYVSEDLCLPKGYTGGKEKWLTSLKCFEQSRVIKHYIGQYGLAIHLYHCGDGRFNARLLFNDEALCIKFGKIDPTTLFRRVLKHVSTNFKTISDLGKKVPPYTLIDVELNIYGELMNEYR